MPSFDIIPDIHGQAAKLTKLLDTLGWQKSSNAWRSPDRGRKIVFLGDFIDRGPDNATVIRIVRELIDAGHASAIMGNHELNAIHFHSTDSETGKPVRGHSAKNIQQHRRFLEEFPLGSREAQEAIEWFMTLPLWLELESFRVVHACWHDHAVASLRGIAPDGVLPRERLISAGLKKDPYYGFVDVLAKGPEVELPTGYSIKDKGGHERTSVRLAWWRRNATSWQDATVSVPDPRSLPEGQLPQEMQQLLYEDKAPPVFFGHYWMTGDPVLETPNALCLDYSAGTDGPLIAYRFEETDRELSRSKIVLPD